MGEVVAYARDVPGSMLRLIDDGGGLRVHLLADGVLESYSEAYWLAPEQTLDLLVLDAMDDTVEIPPVGAPRADIDRLLARAGSLVWKVDKADTLRQILVDRDTQPGLADDWLAARMRGDEMEESRRRRSEEIEASGFLAGMKMSDGIRRGEVVDIDGTVQSVASDVPMMRVEW